MPDQLQKGRAQFAVVEMTGEHPAIIRHLNAERTQ
jgi:hypothetical protein